MPLDFDRMAALVDPMERLPPLTLSKLLRIIIGGHRGQGVLATLEVDKTFEDMLATIGRLPKGRTPGQALKKYLGDNATGAALWETREYVAEFLEAAGLPYSATLLRRKSSESDYARGDDVALELADRIFDEITTLAVFRLPSEKLRFWDQAAPFGDPAFSRFKEARLDATEAGNCYAASRDTACVFHLMRVMEHVLRAIAKSLGIPDPTGGDRNWFNMLKAIKTEMDKRDARQGDPRTRDQAWADHREIYKRAHTKLGLVKEAWRDETMHVDAKYGPEDAFRIHNAVHDLLVELGELPETI